MSANLKFTYLLGAGASYPELPLAIDNEQYKLKGLPGALEFRAGNLAESLKKGDDLLNIYKEFVEETVLEFQNLAKKAREFHTVDTLAKYFYIKDKQELDNLKMTLNKFFLFEQLYFKTFNKKYIVFLSSILQKVQFPNNIKILTWNYDYQLGIAASMLKHEDFCATGKGRVLNKPLISYFPDVSETGWGEDDESISLIHLNGIAGLYKNQFTENPYGNHIREAYQENTKLQLIQEISKGNVDYLTFAWEDSNISKRSLELAEIIVSNTDVLIVIGYSFPFFNREVDKAIFNILKESEDLKIYFQNPYLDGTFLKNQFDLDSTVNIFHVKESDQFYIPFEM